ncbi:MAG: AAA family ATPase [Actinomycetota bacterium]|nr:AAA family ATPase [Actinomycetota bacterium]
MSGPISILVALDGDVARDAVESALPLDRGIHVVGIVDGLEESWATLQEVPADVLAIACAGSSDRVLYLIDGAVRQKPERPVIVFTEGSPNGFVRRLFDAGADDIVTLPESPDQVGFAVQKAVARKERAVGGAGVALAPMICILGPKGGTGKTLTSSNLAVALALGGRKVAVVDLDLQFGDVGLALGLAPDRTIYDLAKSGGSLDAEKLEAYLSPHPSGVRVLMAPTRPDHAGVITTEFLRDVYPILRTTHDYLIVDTPPGFTPEVIASIDSSSDICIVGMLDSLSLKNTKLGLETLELMGYDAARTRVVLNRADSRVGITHHDVVAILGRPPDITVPSDRDIPRSVNEGRPVVVAKSRSEAAKAFQALAALYEPGRNGKSSGGGRRLARFRRSA